MPIGYNDNFSGGCNELAPTSLEPPEVEDCLNVVARGGVLQQAPAWEAHGRPAGRSLSRPAGRGRRTWR